jgi:hypothetical protein
MHKERTKLTPTFHHIRGTSPTTKQNDQLSLSGHRTRQIIVSLKHAMSLETKIARNPILDLSTMIHVARLPIYTATTFSLQIWDTKLLTTK